MAELEPADELAELRELMPALTWRVAKTMPEIPHAYVVRSPENEAVYVRLFRAIRAHGLDQRFGPYRGRYLHLGDGWKYWAMTGAIGQSRIINRDQQLDPATFEVKETAAASAPPGGARGRKGSGG